MGRKLFGIEQGIQLITENGDSGVAILFGANEAGSYGTFDDAAEVGSTYFRTSGEQYLKITAGSGTDKWVKMATVNDVTRINWRPELVRVLTATAAPAEGGTVDATAFTDDNGGLTGADFSVGEYIAFGSGGTEVLGKITVIGTNTLTISYAGFSALTDNDMLLVRKYLPDPSGQENSAIVFYNGSSYVKISDFDWSLATGINLSSGYTPATGNPSPSDTVEVAIQKIDANVDAITSSVGVSQGDTNLGSFTNTVITDNGSVKAALEEVGTDLQLLQTAIGIAAESSTMGTYTGSTLTDNQTAKQNIQELETAVESIAANVSVAAITAITTVDSILVDGYKGVIWDVVISLDSDPARVKLLSLAAVHDGVIGPGTPADAANIDNTIYSKLKIGTAFNSVIAVDLDGTGVAQVMRLRVSASAAVTVSVRRRVIEA